MAICIAMTAAVSHPAHGQPSVCEEPRDSLYLDRMLQLEAAIERSDYETVLFHVDWAIEHYDYAVLEYVRARALHNLDRYEEAEDAYNRFLRTFEGCSDPDMLIISAREYRALAVQQQATALQSATSPSGDEGPPAPNGTAGALDVETGERPIELVEPSSDRGARARTGWIVLGGGGALIVAGVIHDLARMHLIDDKREAYDSGNTEEYARLDDEIRRARIVDFVLYGTGLVAVGVGVALILLDRGEGARTELPVDVTLTTDGAVLGYQGRF